MSHTIHITKDTGINKPGDKMTLQEFRASYPHVSARFISNTDEALAQHLMTWRSLQNIPDHPENAADWFQLIRTEDGKVF